MNIFFILMQFVLVVIVWHGLIQTYKNIKNIADKVDRINENVNSMNYRQLKEKHGKKD